MADVFGRAFATTLDKEGGYSPGRPGDPGGETKYGISKRQYPHLDIKNLTLPEAVAIYRRDYWDEFRCGELPGPLAIVLYDAVVNHSPANPVRWLQHAVGAKPDGLMGLQTVRMANACRDVPAACGEFTIQRLEYVKTLSNYEENPGWHPRHIRVLVEALRP